MAEPAATKVTALAALTVLMGPLAAEYSLMVAASLLGGFIGLSLRAEPLPGLVRPFGHVAVGVGLAMLVTPLGAELAARALPDGYTVSVDLLLPVVALGVGMWWHKALTEWAPGIIGRFVNRGQ